MTIPGQKRPRQRIITFIIDADLDDAVEARAESKRMFKSAVLECAIRDYIEKKESVKRS